MSSWAWCSEEDARLDYLDPAAQVLYLRVLRRNMDFGTGIVGVSARLSYAKLAEWLEVRPPAGSTKPVERLSMSRIRALLAMLERAGLIERVRNKGEVVPLVFKLVFARAGSVRSNEERQGEQQQKREGATAVSADSLRRIEALFSSINSTGSSAFMGVDNPINSTPKTAMNDSKNIEERQGERQTSGSISLSLNNKYISRARGNGALISDDWLPGVEIVKRLVNQFSLPPDFLKLKALEFRVLWRESGVIAENWDWYFFGACKKKFLAGDGEFLSASQCKQ